MSSRRFFRTLIVGPMLLWAAGCAHPIAKEYRQEAVDVPFSQVSKNPAAYTGSTVVWGGQIVETVNMSEGTDIIVLQIPLNGEGKPKEPVESQGRFIARADRFLDPDVYEKERKVTVAGDLVGAETKPLGKMEYSYPVVRIRQLHLWKEEYPAAYVYPYRGWGWYGPYGSPFYPYWWP